MYLTSNFILKTL